MLVILLTSFLSTTEVMSQSSSPGPHCLSCDAVAHPDHCLNVVQCKENQQCYTEKLLHNYNNVFYKLGCMDKDDCSFYNTLMSSILAGRSTGTDRLQCAECCNGNFCNIHGCGTNSLSADFIHCMDCQQIPDAAEKCHTVRLCGLGQLCYARYTNKHSGLGGTNDFLFDMGCWTQTECDKAKNSTSTGCAECCNTGLCNMHLCDSHVDG